MKPRIIVLLMIVLMSGFVKLQAQIDSVIVEKYYISDSNDATNTIGGIISPGSVTYRIFVDLSEGSKLLRIYGNEAHPLKFTSTSVFFNNTDRGVSIGKEIRANRLDQNTLALDTWITLGLATDGHQGVIKDEDTNGSIVGGIQNDGGSAGINGGLLVNADPSAGKPLIATDGLAPVTFYPTNWTAQFNGLSLSSSTDTTIFGNIKQGRSFISNSFYLSNSGVQGISSGNRVLVAQLTTLGDLTFSINVMVEEKNGSGTRIVYYVAENPTGEEKTTRYLTYPLPVPPVPVCGCKDPDYLEFDKTFECHLQDSCKTPIVLGCTDRNACNYDPDANFNVPSLCCYPGRCNNRDINIVCPGLQSASLGFSVYPNPARENLNIEISNAGDSEIRCSVFDSNGSILITENLGQIPETYLYQMNIECLQKGFYVFSLHSGDKVLTRTFIKK